MASAPTAVPRKQVLLVEDNTADVVMMQRTFRERAPEFTITAVETISDARSALDCGQPDVIVADLMLPDGNGMELIAAANARGCPTIMLTGRGSEALAVQALRAGALDYIVKSAFQLGDMPRVVKRALREWESRIEAERNRQLLVQSEQRFRTFAELAADWFWESDLQMALTFVSEGFMRSACLPADRFLGSTFRGICAGSDQDFDWENVEDLWRRRQEFELEITLSSDGREPRTFYLRGKPYRNGRDEFIGYRGIGRDTTRESEALRQITYLAMHDPLTDVLNRRSLEYEVSNALSGVVRAGEEHVFCFFDIDSFKQVNDTAGHLVGDKILRELVGTIAQNVRAADSVGRMGGDEFGVLLKYCGLERAIQIAEAIRSAVAARMLLDPTQPLRLTLSAGIVLLRSGHDIEEVFRNADRACYDAKHAGGNMVRHR